MDTSKLTPEARRVWEFLSSQAALAGFVLIGGSALTMRIAHRISEDLDFVHSGVKLPRVALNGLVKMLERAGFKVVPDDDQAAYEEFLIAGMSLHDYQQNYLINAVKVNFFSPNPDLAGIIQPSTSSLVRVATLPELFRTKALASASRRLSRDWIDLFVLFRDHHFTLTDFHGAFQGPGIHDPAAQIAISFQNLCRGSKSVTDPGYQMLMPNAPTLEEVAAFFSGLRDSYQTEQARLTFQSRRDRSE